jgi:hypothetical protein
MSNDNKMVTANPQDLPREVLEYLKTTNTQDTQNTQNTQNTRKDSEPLACQYCGTSTNSEGEQFADRRGVVAHERYCKDNPDRIASFGASLTSWKEKGHKIVDDKVECKWCGKQFDPHGMIAHSTFHKKQADGDGREGEGSEKEKGTGDLYLIYEGEDIEDEKGCSLTPIRGSEQTASYDVAVYLKLKEGLFEIIDPKKLKTFIQKRMDPFISDIAIKTNGKEADN